ncbi:MAG TPA: hypothetical protein VNM90_21760, partial [Haliangium sp.]|nr:hypothetical protein [Haliangium sp.]
GAPTAAPAPRARPGGPDLPVQADPAPEPAPGSERADAALDDEMAVPRSVSPAPAPTPVAKPARGADASLMPQGGRAMGSQQTSARPATPPALAPARSDTRSASPPAGAASQPTLQSRARESAPEPAKPIIQRTRLVEELGNQLRRRMRLLLLAQQGGGVRRLAEQISEHYFGECVTWLNPPRVPDCTEAEYCRFLAGNERVAHLLALRDWLAGRARAQGVHHLIVLRHDGGPLQHLGPLGDMLRTLIEEPGKDGLRIHVLVAGQAATARLRYEAIETSLFSDAPVRHVPVFSVEEVRQALDTARRDGKRWGQDVWRATGGLPGLVVEAIDDDDLDHASVTARLARSTAVHGRLRRRVLDDDRAQVPAERHARAVLQTLLQNRAVERLDSVEDEFDHPEVRLYYDGLVISDERGETRFLCEAVRRAAAALLAQEQGAT